MALGKPGKEEESWKLVHDILAGARTKVVTAEINGKGSDGEQFLLPGKFYSPKGSTSHRIFYAPCEPAGIPQKVKHRKLLYDSAIPLLGIYTEKTKTLIQKDTCTPMFTAALFTIAKTWKQPKCPSIDNG